MKEFSVVCRLEGLEETGAMTDDTLLCVCVCERVLVTECVSIHQGPAAPKRRPDEWRPSACWRNSRVCLAL